MNLLCNLFIVGFIGVGKILIGCCLVVYYGFLFVDFDQEIEQYCGVLVSIVFEIEGEVGFCQCESQLLDECSCCDGVLLVIGGGVVFDLFNCQWLVECGYVVWLEVSIEQ